MEEDNIQKLLSKKSTWIVIIIFIVALKLTQVLPIGLTIAQGEGDRSKYYGYKNFFGEWIIEPKYEEAYGFYKGAAVVFFINKLGASQYTCINVFGDEIPERNCNF